MSEPILNALMHLFAVIATVSGDDVSESGRKIVHAFLLRYLKKKEIAEEFLGLFDNYIDFYRRNQALQVDDSGFQASLSEKGNLTRICLQIRRELNRNERILVLLRLIEFILEDDYISALEKEFVSLVADAFSLPPEELENAIHFLMKGKDEMIPEKYLLYIQEPDTASFEELEGDWIDKNRPGPANRDNKIIKTGIRGRIIILNFSSLNLFVTKYDGPDELTVDGNGLSPGQVYLLDNGSIIRGSSFGAIYYNEIAGRFLKSGQEINIIVNAYDIEFRFRNSDNGIRRFSFSEESGQLIGIMGSSGVGKSTLLHLLSGQLPLNNGKITINQYDLHHDRFKLKGILGFVPQDDLLFEELTVYQNLYYNARLCFGKYTETKIRETVTRILDDLDLTDIRDMKVGDPLNKFISGGQRKRLNIGLELMREPYILFIDEPTSGLSSMDAENVIRLLKEQTTMGRLVIANIHQPNSNIFKMLDKLWVLDRGGFPVYSGNPVEAIIYFKKLSSFAEVSEAECSSCGHVDPDQILHIIESKLVDDQGRYSNERKIPPETWYEHYQEQIAPGVHFSESRKLLPRSTFSIPDIDVQFNVFFLRNLLQKITNRQYVLLNILETPLLAFILAYFTKYVAGDSYVFSDNKNLPAYLFMSVIVSIFIGLIISAEEIIKDRKILKREAFLNLSRFSYLNSKIIYLFGLSALQTLLFVLIGNWILEIRGMILSYWLILFSAAFCASMLGLNISAGMNSIVNIYIVIPLILIPQLLLSGATVRFDDLNKKLTSQVYVPVIGDLMLSRWAYEAIAVEQAKDNRFEKIFYTFDQTVSEATFNTSYLIPRLLNKLDECNRNLGVEGNREILEKNLLLIHNEVERLGNQPDIFEFEYLSSLNYNDFSEAVSEETLNWLNYYVRQYFLDVSRNASREKDEVYSNLVDSIGSEKVFRMRQDYQNDRLDEIVTNRNDFTKILEIDNRLVQKDDPIYMMPGSNFGRAQFYAPFKKFNGRLYATKWFNLSVIWGFSFIMYITLLLDILRKIIVSVNNLNLRRKSFGK